MKIGLQLYHFHWPGSPEDVGQRVREMAQAADDNGYSSLWIMDHFYQLGRGFGPPEAVKVDAPTMESYATLSYMAGVTRRVKLGALVTGNVYRHPGILVKQVTSLDVLSGGRAILGIGAGWHEYEAKGLGVPWPESVGERFSRLEETLMVAKHMWSGSREPFNGRYYQLQAPIVSPPPLSKPHPPILVGGDGENRLLRLIARHCDMCNFHIGGPVEGYPPVIHEWYADRVERITRKVRKLRRLCEAQGRSLDDVEVTVLATVKVGPDAMTTDRIAALCREMAGLGVDHVIFNMPDAHAIKPIEVIGREVVPAVAELEAVKHE